MHTLHPRLDAPWLAIVAGRVAGPLVIEAECRNAECGCGVGKMAEAAVGANGFVSEGLADHERGVPALSVRRRLVEPTETRSIGSTERQRFGARYCHPSDTTGHFSETLVKARRVRAPSKCARRFSARTKSPSSRILQVHEHEVLRELPTLSKIV
jgi:hypothetical protein